MSEYFFPFALALTFVPPIIQDGSATGASGLRKTFSNGKTAREERITLVWTGRYSWLL
jgi:hypothetical protein